ncbi:MAG: alkaline phosphatase D family protein [Bacteroidota bacterium]
MHRLVLLILLFVGCSSPNEPDSPDPIIFRVTFGSCAHQDDPQPLLDVATELQPDAFVYLGDNIYGDTYDMDTLRAKYNRLGAKPEFQRLRATTRVLATWDDHDYGWNDTGRHYPMQEASKAIFLDFWHVPASSPRYGRPGIYGVEYLERAGKKVQIVLLDTRTFRDDLRHRTESDTAFKNDYVPYTTADSTLLGKAQWAWLDSILRVPSDVRIIATSNQFGHSYNGWESWTNLPHERQRMVDLLATTRARPVFFISGDVHWGEISRLPVPGSKPLYDVTSSGITSTWYNVEPNTNRVGEAVPQNNVGLIELTFAGDTATARLALYDSTATAATETLLRLDHQ